MKPNTPHRVYTIKSAICHGGHFYCMSTIRESTYGILHHFAASSFLTNTQHTADSRLLLRRIVVYIHYIFVRRQFDTRQPTMPTPHVPNVSTFEGTIDLFMICVIMELGNLLNPQAYRRGTHPERQCDPIATLYSRGLARDIMDWWHAHYELVSEDGTRCTGWELFDKLFSHQARVLAIYRRVSEERGIFTDEHECTAAEFETWLTRYHGKRLGFRGPVANWVSQHKQDQGWKSASFAWPGPTYSVKARTTPMPHKASKP